MTALRSSCAPNTRDRICWALILLLALGLAGCRRAPQYPEATPEINLEDPGHITQGHRLFLQKCALCHGRSDEGRGLRVQSYNPPAPGFTEPHYRSADPAYLFWRIRLGKTIEPYLSQGSVMPAWEPHLNSIQCWQLVAYLRTRPLPKGKD